MSTESISNGCWRGEKRQTMRLSPDSAPEDVEDLFYQYVKLLEKQGETDHETVFVDGTKLESCAGGIRSVGAEAWKSI